MFGPSRSQDVFDARPSPDVAISKVLTGLSGGGAQLRTKSAPDVRAVFILLIHPRRMKEKASKGVKRLTMKIAGREVGREEASARTREASAAWLRDRRGPKEPKPPRRHRQTSQAEKEAKKVATAHAKRIRAADREARELERLLARVGYLSRRSAQEAEVMLKVQLSWKASSRRKLTTICPRNLYSRLELEIAERRTKAATRSRIASDGYKNIVLSRTMRGFGRRAHGTRAYQFGEAADLTRYILRPDALEPGVVACFTNIVTPHHDDFDDAEATALGLEEVGRVVAFWDAGLSRLRSEATRKRKSWPSTRAKLGSFGPSFAWRGRVTGKARWVRGPSHHGSTSAG